VTSNVVDGALAAPPDEVGARLLAVPEDQWFDRKSIRVTARDLAPALVAFANAEGGTIVIGLHDGKVEGIEAYRPKVNEYRQASLDFTTPPVRMHCSEVPCVNESGAPDSLFLIRVDPGERVHETVSGECYLRVGDESRRLNFAQRQELGFDRGQSIFDGHPADGASLSDLDDELVENYRDNIGSTGDVRRALSARSLLLPNDVLTNAGYLLFARSPQDLFPQAHVRILKFLDIHRGTGARLGLDESGDRRVEGPIPRIVMEAQDIIEELMPVRRSLGESGRFEGRPIVPRDAWLEGLVNAVVHRSYSLGGDHIRIEIYPNRIEIESPGRFPGLANPNEPLNISRFARNPRIARVCADLRIGQELGEGIRRIFDEMRRVGLTDPVYKQSQGSVRLVLAAVQRIPSRLAARLPRGSERLFDIVRAAERPLGTGDIVELVSMSRPSVLQRLRALEEVGLIVWKGKSSSDPRAVWEISDEW
jgi:ATP-dependent DNA helicase RecG